MYLNVVELSWKPAGSIYTSGVPSSVATPLSNLDMMALGYERDRTFSLELRTDQHFSQRNRFNDLKL